MDIKENYLFPYARKGLANNIPEEDVFGNVSGNEALAKMRAVLTIHTQYKASGLDEENENNEVKDENKDNYKTLLHDKEIGLYGPADVSSISPAAVLKCRPAAGSSDFPAQYFPYIEFREPDFPWRFTPAKIKDDKLTPWLALVVLEKEIVTVQKDDNKLPVVKFNGDKEAYQAAFPKMSELWKTAHAQSPKKETALFSRIISLRGVDPKTGIIPPLKEDTDYIACLVPSYETGRLRGLGVGPEDLQGITAQAPAWEDYDIQKGKQRGMEFPVYFSWSFRSGGASFEELVKSLQVVKSGKAGLAVDVTHMGNGFDYEAVYAKNGPGKNVRKTITIPAATKPQPPEPEEKAFPDKVDEKDLYDNLQSLLKSSYIFLENAADIGQKIPKGGPDEGDDPCVVPPVYGARHILATKLDKQPWMNKINMDVHYRIAAGLGRKAVIENQEMLMDRAWKQVEAVQALNMELYKRLLSIGANNALQGKTVGQYGENNKYLASMMFYLSSMREAYKKKGDPTLASVLEERDVPRAFATPSFHGMTDRVAKIVADLDTKSVMENILEYQTYRFPDHQVNGSYPISSLKDYSNHAFKSIFGEIKDNRILNRIWVHHVIESSGQSGGGISFKEYDVYAADTVDLPGWIKSDNTSLVFDTEDNRKKYNYKGESVLTPIPAIKDIYCCPTSPHSWLASYIENIKNKHIFSSANIYQCDEILQKFFDEGFDRHDCMGYMYDFDSCYGEESFQLRIREDRIYLSSNHSDNVDDSNMVYHEVKDEDCDFIRPNMVVMRNGDYSLLFGKSLFTGIKYNGQTIYFADFDRLYEEVIKQNNGNYLCYFNVPYGSMQAAFTLPATHFIYYDFVGPGGKPVRREAVITCCNVGMVGSFPDLTSLGSQELKNKYNNNRKKALEYMQKTPAAFKINLPKVPSEDIQIFESFDAYREFLQRNSSDSVLPYMHMWYEFDQLILQLERDYPKKEVQEKPKQNNNGAAAVIKDNLRNTTPYDDSIGILTDFYSAYFSNSVTANNLQGKYIDELLMSKYPILAYPIFPEPTYKYLKEFSEEFIIPGIGDIPMDSVSVFSANASFIESYLAGLNTEMGRELLWREYPTDQRGSYFRKFWDSEVSMKDIVDDNFYDIKPVHSWLGELGTNMRAGKDNLLIFAIKGRLMKLYPTTRICLWPAKLVSKNKIDFDKSATFDNKKILQPIMESFLNEDVLLVGFKTDISTALGNPAQNKYGYILTFIEDVEDLNFTMEEDDDLSHPNAGLIAKALMNDPSYYGKHVSLFIK